MITNTSQQECFHYFLDETCSPPTRQQRHNRRAAVPESAFHDVVFGLVQGNSITQLDWRSNSSDIGAECPILKEGTPKR